MRSIFEKITVPESEAPETSVLELSARRIQLCGATIFRAFFIYFFKNVIFRRSLLKLTESRVALELLFCRNVCWLLMYRCVNVMEIIGALL